jgi:hypothetical protein
MTTLPEPTLETTTQRQHDVYLAKGDTQRGKSLQQNERNTKPNIRQNV